MSKQHSEISGRLRLGSNALLLALLCSFFVLQYTSNANAQSRAQVCRGLSNQLASLGNSRASGGNSAKYRQFDSAVRKQSNQITRAKRALRRNGCIGLFKKTKSQCRAIDKSLKKMQRNLANLKKQRSVHAPKRANSSSKRRKILAAMRRNRCDRVNNSETRQANNQEKTKSRRRTILEQVFGVRAYDDQGNRRSDQSVEGDSSIASRYGTYRTLCVRKSDGYYFPISFSTVRDRFEEDELACQAMCPGAEVGLYHHRMPNEDSEDMISFATNQAYRDEPFAFAYRKEHNPNNRCRFSTAGINQSVDSEPSNEVKSTVKKVVRIGLPVFRQDPSLSPDAYDTKLDGLTADRIISYFDALEQKERDGEDPVIAENRNVRIVGPAFFPVQ